MKFANIHSALNSGRFSLRLVLFSFICLTLFAVSSPRFGIAPAAGAVASTGAQEQIQASGRKTSTRVKGSSRQTAKVAPPSSEKSSDDFQPSVVCGQQAQAISLGATVNGTLTESDCRNPVAQAGSAQVGTRVDEYTFSGTAGQKIAITLDASDRTALDTYLYLLRPDNSVFIENDDIDSEANNTNSRIPADFAFIVLPVSGTYSILASSFNSEQRGAYTLRLQSGGLCSSTSITAGQQTSGTLSQSDCTNPIVDIGTDDGTFADTFIFTGTAGQAVSVDMSAAFDTYLYLIGPNGEELAQDNNGGGGTNSRVPATTGFGRLPANGIYTIIANSFNRAATGSYNLTLRTGTACPSTSITVGQTGISGSLDSTDCRLLLDGTLLDTYTFSGTAGQVITATMTSSADSLNPYLYLLAPNGSVLSDAGNTTERSVSIQFSLPVTGVYTILANSARLNQSGAYSLTVTSTTSSCTFALDSTSRAFAASGGTGSVSVTASATTCSRTAVSNVPWITITGGATGAGNGTVTYNVAANTGAARTGTITVAGQTFTVTQEAVQLVCTYALSAASQTVSALGGNLSFGVTTQAGCPLTATSNVAWIIVNSASADANGAGTVSYTVQANSETQNRTGAITLGGQTHTVTQTSAALPPPTVRFSAATFMTAENDATRVATITVERTGDASGTATIEIATVDDPAAVPCDPTVRDGAGNLFPQGRAYARCDYATTIDIVTFPAGDTQPRRFTIPLINDVHVEGNETLQLVLRNPQGATIGTQATATLTIIDDDANVSATNPINQTPFFVRQQYLDFLSREPEPGEPWTGVLNRCPNVNNLDPRSPSAECDRILVSFSFFGSPEFRLKGFFVFLHYKASFGSAANPNYVPTYEQIVPDLRRVTGQTAEEVFAKRLQFTADWVTRPEFVSAYPATLSAAAFVDRLLSNVGATLTTADSASGVTRNSLVADLEAGRRTRADVLRLIVESNEATAVQFSRAFVAIQYYGYLRRTPEAAGYQSWLNVINNQNEDAATRNRTMINGFMNSAEYRLRFGPNTLQ